MLKKAWGSCASALLSIVVGPLFLPTLLAAQVSSSPSGYIFSPTALGVASQTTLTITVSSGTTLGAVSVLTMGAPNLDFTAVAGGTTCAAGITAATCNVEVQFKPTVPGRRLGMLVLADSSGNALLVVSLDGVGVAPLASFSPGTVSTLAGASTGLAAGGAKGVAADGFGNLYIADQSANLVYKQTPAGVLSTFAGNGTAGYSGDGSLATSAELNGPMAVVVDGAGYVYIADTGNNVVRIVSPAGIISTYAGQYYAAGTTPPSVCASATDAIGDGCAPTKITLNEPTDLAFCHAQNLHIADKNNNSIRAVLRTSNYVITQVGNGKAGYNGDTATVPGLVSTTAELNGPTGIDMDGSNYIYIADEGNHIVRKTLLTGNTPNAISTVAGMPGASGYSGDGGAATSAQLATPNAVKVDPAGNLYISDTSNNVVRKVDVANGYISTFAGTSANGAANIVSLNAPAGLFLDDNGNLDIVDASSSAIRHIEVSAPPSLSFSAAQGSASAEQDVSLLNIGNVTGSQALPLKLSQVTVAPSVFSLTSDTTCSAGSSLNPGETCLLGVKFSPAAIGTISGTVSFTDNSFNGATQTLALSGTGLSTTSVESYTIAVPSGSAAVSVSSGSSATVKLNLNSTNYAGTVSFATSVTSSNGTAAAVTATASPVTLAAGGSGTATLTITTTASAENHTPTVPWKSGSELFCAILLCAPFIPRRKRILALLLPVVALSTFGVITGCGGGSSTNTKMARTYTVTVTPTGTATASATVANPTPVSVTVTVQ